MTARALGGLALVSAVLFADRAHAEATRVEVDMLCPIVEVAPGDAPGTLRIRVGRGSEQGVVRGSHGDIYARGESGGVGGVVARGEVIAVEANEATAVVAPGPGSDLARVIPGGELEVRILVPADVHRGALFRLAMLDIEFVDQDSAPLVTRAELVGAKTDAVERAALAKMVAAGREVADLMSGRSERQTRTRWKGKLIHEVLRGSDERDYLGLLHYMEDFSRPLIGARYRAEKAYTQWLIARAPPGYDDRYADLAATRGAERRALARAMTDDELRWLIVRFRRNALAWPTERIEEAWQVYRTLEEVVRAQASASGLARAELAEFRARLLVVTPSRAMEAVKAFREAAGYYLALPDAIAQAEGITCLNTAASKLQELERDAEALAEIGRIRATIPRLIAQNPSPFVASQLRYSELFTEIVAARVASHQGRYAEVVAQLKPLVERAAAHGAPGARTRELDALELIAGAQNRLGRHDEAAVTFARMNRRADELGDDARRAAIAFALGDLHYGHARYDAALTAFVRSAEIAHAAGIPAAEAKGLAATGQSLWRLGKHADALAWHARAMRLREGVAEDRSGLAWELVEVGKLRAEMGDRELARTLFERALALYQQLGEASSEADVHEQLGDLALSLKRYDDAAREWSAARAIYHRLARLPLEANAVAALARVRARLGDDTGAEQLLQAAVVLADRSGDRDQLIDLVRFEASLRANRGDRARARALLERVLPKDADRDPGVTCDVLGQLADLDLRDGLVDAAAVKNEDILARAAKAHDAQRHIAALLQQQEIRATRGDFEGSVTAAQAALQLARTSGNRPAIVNALQILAWLYADLGRLADAKAANEEALPLTRAIDDPEQTAWVLGSLANVHDAYGDVGEALRALDEAIHLVEAGNHRLSLAALVLNRASIHLRQRDTARALAEYRRAETIAGKGASSEFRIALLGARAEALALAGRPAEAEAPLRPALAMARTANPARVPELLVVLASVLSRLGRHGDAVAAAREAADLEARITTTRVVARAMLGRVLAAAGQDADARAALATAIAGARAQGGALPWEALYELAALQAKAGDRASAIALLQEAVGAIERAEVGLAGDASARSHADKVDVFQLLVKLLLADHQIAPALQYLERSKVAELRALDQGLGSGGDRTRALAIELDVQEKRLEALLDTELAAPSPNAAKIEQLDDLLGAAKRRRAEFIESLDRDNALYDRYAVRPLQLEKVQPYLGEGVTFVAPVLLGDRVVVFAVTRDVLTYFTTEVAATDVRKLVNDFVRELDPRGAAGVKGRATQTKARQKAERLYDLLLRPALAALGTPRVLVVSPTGPLRYVPFAALHDGSAWLVAKTALVNVTALDREKFAAPAPHPGPDASILGFGDPDGNLAAARTELADVDKLFARVDLFEGKDASAVTLRHRLRVPGYEILHFATHGQLDAKDPERSSILLADGPLSYAAIPTLAPLKTQLVVLSACQTAVLSGGSGLEIAGLAYQFQRGPIHAVLATLWDVDDNATAALMLAFYQGVHAGKRYADALAEAQRALIARGDGFDHPAYWGAFILMGTP